MNKVFDVELYDDNGESCKLSLPATDYELLDALEQIQKIPREQPEWEISRNSDFQFLHKMIEGRNLYAVNDLSRKLGSMDQGQRAAFEGLLRMACLKQEESVSVTDLLIFANSVDHCHVVAEATDDAKLGRFYAENDFIPELVDIPDDVFEKLDFAKIGREMRESEKGVFTQHGYVVMHDELRPYTEPIGATPQAPDYIFRLSLHSMVDTKRVSTLDLPASMGQIMRAVEECGVGTISLVEHRIEDSAIPSQKESMESGTLLQINELAQAVKYRQERGELPKLKAVLQATNCPDVDTAIAIEENLDAYSYDPGKRTAEDVALGQLHRVMDEQTLPILLDHIHLFNYGMDLMAAKEVTMTPYGAVTYQNDEMLLTPENKPSQGGMQMQ